MGARHLSEPDFSSFQILIDQPAEQVTSRTAKLAESLAAMIERSPAQFAVGIFGPWGTGKTTLMDAIRHRLDDRYSISVEYNAWRHEGEPDQLVPLLDYLSMELRRVAAEREGEIKSYLVEIANAFGKAALFLLRAVKLKLALLSTELELDAAEALSSARRDAEADEPRSLQVRGLLALREAATKIERLGGIERIVVFVDDLDRCLPESALRVLESMKLFFDTRGFVFVVGVDRLMLEQAIDRRYGWTTNDAGGSINGRNYLKKIFQVPVTLPPMEPSRTDELIRCLGLPEGSAQSAHFRDELQPFVRALAGWAGLTPRELKRFLNAYVIEMHVQPDPSVWRVVAALKTLEFRGEWTEVYEDLVIHGDLMADALSRYVENPNDTSFDDHALRRPPSEIRTFLSDMGRVLVDDPSATARVAQHGSQARGAGSKLLEMLRIAAKLKTAKPRDSTELIKQLGALESEIPGLRGALESARNAAHDREAESEQESFVEASEPYDLLRAVWRAQR